MIRECINFLKSLRARDLWASLLKREVVQKTELPAHPLLVKIYHSESQTIKSVKLPTEISKEFDEVDKTIDSLPPLGEEAGGNEKKQPVLYWPSHPSRLTH